MAASCPYGDRPTERVSAASSARLKPIAGRGSTAGAHGERAATEALPADIAANAATTPERFAEMVAAAKDYIAAATISRSEEHTSELQSLMRNSYAVFCLKNKNNKKYKTNLYNKCISTLQPTQENTQTPTI